MFGVVDKCHSFRRSRFRNFSAIFGSVRSSTDGESPLTINNFYKAAYDVAQRLSSSSSSQAFSCNLPSQDTINSRSLTQGVESYFESQINASKIRKIGKNQSSLTFPAMFIYGMQVSRLIHYFM